MRTGLRKPQQPSRRDQPGHRDRAGWIAFAVELGMDPQDARSVSTEDLMSLAEDDDNE